HMSVVHASPGKLLRLSGAIGPLQEAALTGTMTWNLAQAGGGTTVELSYTVGGFRAGGFCGFPPRVDGGLRGQACPAEGVRRNRSSGQRIAVNEAPVSAIVDTALFARRLESRVDGPRARLPRRRNLRVFAEHHRG